MSTVGRLNSGQGTCGFTLIELVAVISIASILLFFSFPLVNNFKLFNDPSGQVGDIVRLAEDLKLRAKKENVDYLMHIERSLGRIWVGHEEMGESERSESQDKATALSGQISISDIEFPVIGRVSEENVTIRFRKEGYSDYALIHMVKDDEPMTLKIHPFLDRVEQIQRYVSFEDCNQQ